MFELCFGLDYACFAVKQLCCTCLKQHCFFCITAHVVDFIQDSRQWQLEYEELLDDDPWNATVKDVAVV